jgi:hypothetical protein
MIIRQISIGDMDNFSYLLGWEKRHNVNAREYGYHVAD